MSKTLRTSRGLGIKSSSLIFCHRSSQGARHGLETRQGVSRPHMRPSHASELQNIQPCHSAITNVAFDKRYHIRFNYILSEVVDVLIEISMYKFNNDIYIKRKLVRLEKLAVCLFWSCSCQVVDRGILSARAGEIQDSANQDYENGRFRLANPALAGAGLDVFAFQCDIEPIGVGDSRLALLFVPRVFTGRTGFAVSADVAS